MIVTFGEALFRFGTPAPMLLSQASRMDFFLGGAELNVAMALGSQGLPARWVSCLPDREIGDLVLETIRRSGVDVSRVRRADGRMGYYLMETGAGLRPSRVLERQKSVLGEREDLDFDWPEIFKGANWFHSTGITAGLSPACRETLSTAMVLAAARDIPVSYDFNYRGTVWSSPAEAREKQIPLLENVNVLFCSAADFSGMFETELPPAGHAGYYPAVQRALEPYRLDCAVLSERGGDGSSQTYRAVVLSHAGPVFSPTYPLEIVDRIGAGDAMTAGFIRARLEKRDPQATVDFAGFCGALQHTIPGDFLPLNGRELDRLYQQPHGGLHR